MLQKIIFCKYQKNLNLKFKKSKFKNKMVNYIYIYK